MNGFNANVPIYIQVVEDMKMKIMNGTLKPGDKIASVREIAVDLGVNPNTIQRAFAELEREGFIRTERAVGRYVADNPQLIKDYKKKEGILHERCASHRSRYLLAGRQRPPPGPV